MTDCSNTPTPESTANFDLDSRCFSEAMTSNADYTTAIASDGNVKKTFAAALREAGQEHVGEWSTNPEVTESNQVIPYAGTNQLFRPLSLPYQVDSATNPDPNALLPNPATGYAGELVDVSKFIDEDFLKEKAVNRIAEASDAQNINFPLGAVVEIVDRGNGDFLAVTGEVVTGYGVLATADPNIQLKVIKGNQGASLLWYGVKPIKSFDSLPATQEAVNENPLTLWPEGDLFFDGELKAPEGRHTRYEGAGRGITNVYGVDGKQITTLAGPGALSVTARGITFHGEFDRSGINFPYHANGASAPKGANWAFTYTQKTNCDIDYSDCEFRDFYELPFACFNVKGKVKFNRNVLWKTKDPGFVNCGRVECCDNESYFGHDNGLSLSRGNKSVKATGNFMFSPAFVGLACYGFPLNGIDETGPDGFTLSNNLVEFSGQANISNVRAPRNGVVSDNVCKYAGCYCDIDKVNTTGTILFNSATLDVANGTNIQNGSKLVLIPDDNTQKDYFFCEVVSGGGGTSLTVDRQPKNSLYGAKVYLIQYNPSAQGYVSSGSTDGTKVHSTGVNVHDNLFMGFAKIGMQLGTSSGSIKDGSANNNQIVKTDPMFDSNVIGIQINDSGDTSYRTSNYSVKTNQINLTGSANAKGLIYNPVDETLSSYCAIEENTVTGTTDANRFDIPDAFNPVNSGITPNTKGLIAFAESINVRGTASISGSKLTVTGRYCRGSAAAPTNITDIEHTYGGSEYPEFIFENTSDNAVTFMYDDSKIRINGKVNKVVNKNETIRFIKITNEIYQEI